ncbi:MAG: hypothetical protein LUC24_04675 [Bacteroidales bacterium]|nr:hypothetical protein [Bacteroidales bacterium]
MKKIALKNFSFSLSGDYNLYESDLGWGQDDFDDAMASTVEGVLRYYLDRRYDLYFFDPKTMRWYYIDTCSSPEKILVRMKPRKDWDGKFLDDNIEPFSMTDDDLDILFRCDTVDEFMKGATIEGDPVYDVVARSYIDFS